MAYTLINMCQISL